MVRGLVLLCLSLVVIQTYCQPSTSSCPTAPLFPQDRRTDTSKLVVATYNAEWLFLANEEDPTSCPEAGCPYDTLAEAVAHVEAIAAEIQKLNADVVNLVEVEGCEVLDLLNEKIGTSYGYKGYLVRGDDDYTGQNVALLTRIDPVVDLQRTSMRVDYPVPNTACTGEISDGSYSVSKHYYTKINVTNTMINLFSVHFLAYPDDEERCYKREAQATVISDYMNEMVSSSDESTIVFGDMNDFDSTIQDPAGNKPISNVLYFLKSAFPTSFYGSDLLNVGTMVPYTPIRFSAWWDKNDNCNSTSDELSVIDHTLVDPNLFNRIDRARYSHDYAPTCDTAISDHWPVKSTYNF